MAELEWDTTGDRTYETGVDHGVLYIPDNTGAYVDGVAWNGLTTVTETPSGAEAQPQYADNMKYLNLFSAEELGLTIEAFTYPHEFERFDGLGEPSPGLTVGQQTRKPFGLSYRTKIGNDMQGEDYGTKLHLVYNCTASPSEKAYATINDSPAPIAFSWTVTTVSVPVPNFKPSAILTLNSTRASSAGMTALMHALYGTAGVNPQLPLPGDVIAMFTGSTTVATPVQPGFAANVITIPTTVGVNYYIKSVLQPAGALPAIAADTVVTARPKPGYVFPDVTDDDWLFKKT